MSILTTHCPHKICAYPRAALVSPSIPPPGKVAIHFTGLDPISLASPIRGNRRLGNGEGGIIINPGQTGTLKASSVYLFVASLTGRRSGSHTTVSQPQRIAVRPTKWIAPPGKKNLTVRPFVISCASTAAKAQGGTCALTPRPCSLYRRHPT